MRNLLNLHKLRTSLNEDNRAIYQLGNICLNDYVGQNLKIEYLNEINCVACGAKTSKSYSQGHCFMCMKKLPECDICMIKPELCHFSQGTCRDAEWGKNYCMNTHIVYLANTGNAKVGITKLKNTPSRWIDQGASQAIPIFVVTNRLISGLVELTIKKHISDRTNWRKMLQNISDNYINLFTLKDQILEKAHASINEINLKYGQNSVEIATSSIQNICYPVVEYPTKVKSLSLDKNNIIEGKLMGIKGQYLIFDLGVINIRKFSGYRCSVSV